MSEETSLGEFAGDSTPSDVQDEEIEQGPTEIGKLPAEWSAATLDEVASGDENAFVDGPFGANLLSEEFHNEGFARIIKLQNIRSSEFIDTNRRYITEQKHQEISRHAAAPGDIAIAKMAEPVARACLLPDTEDRYILAAADVVKLTPSEDYNSIFVMTCLNSHRVWRQAFSRSRGTGRKRINLNQLKEVQIPSPPIEEQRKIASVLYNVDQTIQKTETIVQKAYTIVVGLMQDLFRHGINDPELKELRRIGKLPQHWDVVNLKDVCSRVTDGTHKSPPTVEDGYPYITSQNIRDWGLDLSGLKYISEEDHERITSRCNPEPGDVLYVKDGANTGNVNVNTLDFEFSLLSRVSTLA